MLSTWIHSLKKFSFACTYINGVVSHSQLLPSTYHIWLFCSQQLSSCSREVANSIISFLTDDPWINRNCLNPKFTFINNTRYMYILEFWIFCSCRVWLLTRSGLDRCPFRAPAILVMIRLFISSVPLRLSLVSIHSSERTAILTCSVPCLKLKSISSLIMPCT